MNFFIATIYVEEINSGKIIKKRIKTRVLQAMIREAKLEDSSGKRAKEHAFNALFWPVLVGAILFDFLALCNLVPTHSQHLYRPYMLSGVQFKVFKN